MYCSPERAQKIVSACCVLHNYFLRCNKSLYCPAHFADGYDENGQVVEGEWRRNVNDMTFLDNTLSQSHTPNEQAINIRNIFKEFVNSPDGSLEWQRRAVFLEP